MSIFSKIRDAIFGGAVQAAPGQTGSPTQETKVGASEATSTASPAPTAEGAKTDITPILDKAVASTGEKLFWKTSIVDLMKALDLDSSLTARKELAKELGYTGDTSDSATMNVWLHKQVMQKLAANGGKVPAELQ